jgi:hypothetical protein
VNRGYQGEARTNDFLAARRFLRRMGVPARSGEPEDLMVLPPAGATIFMPSDRLTLGEARSKRLLDWVRRGGHLITQIRRPIEGYVAPDPIADPLGVRGRELDWEEIETAGPVVFAPPASTDLIEIDFQEPRGLETENTRLALDVGDMFGSRILSLRHGDGLVTLLSESAFLSNSHIGDYGHARMLYLLARLQPQPGGFLIFHQDDMPPLYLWLWQTAPALILTAALALLLWLLRAPRRFGPLLPSEETPRRRIMEHVNAAGHYLWHRGHSAALTAAVRRSLDRRMARAIPDRGEGADLTLALAERTGVSLGQIREALAVTSTRDTNTFLRTVQTLEALRKRL